MSEISELLESYQALDDKIAAIFVKSGMERIPTDLKTLHTAFYHIAKAHSAFFPNLHFKIGGRFPYSEALDQTFPGLAIAGLLSCENPKYEFYVIDKEKRTIIQEKILPLFSREEQTEIEEIGLELLGHLAVPSL